MTIVESCRFILGSPDLLRARASARHFDQHMHDTLSVVVLTAGSASLQSNRWSKRAQPGDVFFFNPFEVHSGGSLDQPARYEVLYPSPRFVSDCLSAGDCTSTVPLVRTDVLRRCAATEAFVDALSSPTSGAAPIETALRKLLQNCSFEPAGFAASGMTAVRAACQFIDERYMRAIRTDMLARHVGLHKSHFVRIFHRATGIAPQTYVRQLRIARARELICAGAELCEAAQSVGFCDQAHLTREFRKVYGVTPGRLSHDLRANSH
ncbi:MULTISPECIES: AraC family transcriptional regulator [unclassified Mesorhizobium]|uniref:helix-turn-helix transcriptional regulator n=1 Tax=unclassified Mesorhizobium TaxID=325217 RepID=UPI00333D2B41